MIGFLIIALFATGAVAAVVTLADSTVRGMRAYRMLAVQLSSTRDQARMVTRVQTLDRYSERYAPRPQLVSHSGRSRHRAVVTSQRLPAAA
ncbi:hypothetical protein GRI44_03460 [Altererythrobacter confluentis]|uniref:Uncharacterized protein n=1 Tax=Allopontixanthobacter confluentis TaxID=1849021 RepID=A0A6L7GFR6_9SPHN|nr:hypothetical protein [Allopontixanthobacter confluentis]MXP13808.1 hypothetical protein [Allopontixanthobacter confluentis]